MALSPMMRQYLDIKEANPDSILFFRLGDFYEMFFEDAKICSRELELTLTGKDCGLEERAPMCGVPHHSSQIYIQKLIEKGYKVAVCEQVEDPKNAKGIVKREVVKIITPGTLIDGEMLDETKNNYVASIVNIGKEFAISYADVSTGECYVSSIEGLDMAEKIIDEAIRIGPSEFVFEKNIIAQKKLVENICKRINTYVSVYEESKELEKDALNLINKHKLNLKEVEKEALIKLLSYIINTQKSQVSQINNIQKYELDKFMRLDMATRRNLEILESNREKTKKGSLLWVLDKTSTAMGARQIKKWLEKPLLDKGEINKRLDAVETIKNNMFFKDEVIDSLKKIYDIERIITKVASGNTNGRDFIALKNSIHNIPTLKQCIKNIIDINGFNTGYLINIYNNLDELADVYELIERSILEDVGITIKEGNIIKKGYNEEVDKYRSAATQGKSWLMELEAREKELTGIKNLKVGYNRIFGYYIEITKSFLKHVPEDRYMRKQTLTGAERYITEELKNIEETVLGSQEKLMDLEYNLFLEIRERVASCTSRIQQTAQAIAIMDVLCSFAIVADSEEYVKPKITDDGKLNIIDGRHPVVEKSLKESFIPNDTKMDTELSRLHIITGPNMSGKSTYMRQIALIVYMAQVGCFIPASSADIGIVDRIFTRVGASDDLAMGESTFMVEMVELSNILEHATQKSLVILDEIGRGTSTYDGLAIAWATVEYISDKSKIGAKTLFATHYHELTELEEKTDGIKNFSVSIKEKGDDVIFLHKIIEGAADESYGIYVAKLAGVPRQVLTRSKALLKGFEESDLKRKAKKNETQVINREMQVDMFNYKLAEIGKMLDKISLDELSAKEALDTLYKMKEKME